MDVPLPVPEPLASGVAVCESVPSTGVAVELLVPSPVVDKGELADGVCEGVELDVGVALPVEVAVAETE